MKSVRALLPDSLFDVSGVDTGSALDGECLGVAAGWLVADVADSEPVFIGELFDSDVIDSALPCQKAIDKPSLVMPCQRAMITAIDIQ